MWWSNEVGGGIVRCESYEMNDAIMIKNCKDLNANIHSEILASNKLSCLWTQVQHEIKIKLAAKTKQK